MNEEESSEDAVRPAGSSHRRRESEVFRERTFNQAPMCLSCFNLENRLVGANEAALRAMGAREAGIIGLKLEEIEPGPPYDLLTKLMAQVLQTGQALSQEVFVRSPGESRAHAWLVFLSPLTDPDGQICGVSNAALDITEQYWARRRLAIANEASTRIGTTLDVTRTAQELADVTTGRFADFVAVDLLDSVLQGEEPEPRRPTGLVVFRRIAHQSILEGVPETAVKSGEKVFFPESSPMVPALSLGRAARYSSDDADIQRWLAEDPVRARAVRRYGIHSFIASPLLARGITLGICTFLRHRTETPFDTEDLILAEEITARAAVCVDNARRYTHERDTALALQRSLLPSRAPRQAAVEVAARYLPSGSRAGVGGDWFDVIPLSGARVALVVGDVVGRGIHASATMGRLRTAVRALADIDMAPDELLTHLDDVVLRLDREEEPMTGDPDGARDTGPISPYKITPRPSNDGGGDTRDIGATCLYAVYDPTSRRCSIALAGHPAPAIVRPDGTVELPDLPVGPPLGLGGLPFESAELELSEGSLIVLYTNGLIEPAVLDVDAGLERLRHSLTGAAPSLEELCDQVLAELPQGSPTDDVTLLIARTLALDTSQVAAWGLPSDPTVVARARQQASEQLATWGLDEEISFITELVVSELVTNAIRYGHPPIHLRLIHNRSLICEVSDGSNTAPHLRRARIFDEGGRGLLLVAQLTQRWGTRQTQRGKTIWAELSLHSD